MRKVAFIVLAGLSCWLPERSSAHVRSETNSSWHVDGRIVHLAFIVPQIEAKRLAPAGSTAPSLSTVGAYVARNVGASANGAPCPRIGPIGIEQAVSATTRYAFVFACPSDNRIQVHSSAFFALVPNHTNFAQIQLANGEFIEQLITADRQTLDAFPGGALGNAGFFRYVELGILHIFTGIDHQCFLLGLIFLSRKFRDLAFVITGFTLGHSITLALAVTGLLRPHGEYIDAMIGLTIALVGAENLAVTSGRTSVVAMTSAALLIVMAAARAVGLGGLPVLILVGSGLFSASYLTVAGQLRDAARLRLIVTLVFGLIHGFGFAADLLELKLPKDRLAELLVGFNLGVEIGQLSIVLLVTGVLALLVRRGIHLPRPVAASFASAFLIGIGLYWFTSRSYG